jgi:CDP-diacylglycerol--serine O-phosphatidyltransferase
MIRIRKSIPSWFTGGNLLLGVMSIIFSAKGEMTGASICIFLAAILDFFDGFVARALNAMSDFGKEFDSLADMVTFGAAPALLLFYMAESLGVGVFKYATLLLALFVGIRLAIFNVDTRQASGFIGLPSPAMGITVASFPLIIEFQKFPLDHWISNPWFVLLFSGLFAFLMVAPLPMFALKFKNFTWNDNQNTFIFLATCIIWLAVFKFMGIPFIIISYIIWSLVHTFASKSA